MRGRVIKDVLTELGVNTRGVLEKSDLARLLQDAEDSWSMKSQQLCKRIPFRKMDLGMATKTYVGIDVEIRGKKFVFMVDTGASMNLIRPHVAQALQLDTQSKSTYSQGLGGGGMLSANTAFIDKVTIGDGFKSVPMPVAVLNNVGPLPPSADGLVGLTFLQSLGQAVNLNFITSEMHFGNIQNVLSPLQRLKQNKISYERQFSGLLFCPCDIHVKTHQSGEKKVTCLSLIDIGSSYSIINSAAVKALGMSMESLPTSPVVVAGIDNRPLPLRNLGAEKVTIGSIFDSKIDPFPFNSAYCPYPNKKDSICIYAADIPGLMQMGYGNMPAMILGLDVLGRSSLALDFQSNSMYLPRPDVKAAG
jgi:hypothetical protein